MPTEVCESVGTSPLLWEGQRVGFSNAVGTLGRVGKGGSKPGSQAQAWGLPQPGWEPGELWATAPEAASFSSPGAGRGWWVPLRPVHTPEQDTD